MIKFTKKTFVECKNIEDVIKYRCLASDQRFMLYNDAPEDIAIFSRGHIYFTISDGEGDFTFGLMTRQNKNSLLNDGYKQLA